jgi:hemoglobin
MQAIQLPAVTAVPLPAALDNPHYRQLGGEPALRSLVDRFYQLMDELPEARMIRALHPADLGPAREKLFLFLSGWVGGPLLYSERHGPPRLRHKHLPFPINATARDAWMACMKRALDEQVADDAAFFRTADFLRNQP